jgi:hypothetical protein
MRLGGRSWRNHCHPYGSRTCSSASNALSAICVSASIVGRGDRRHQIVRLAAGQENAKRLPGAPSLYGSWAQSTARASRIIGRRLCWWARTMVLSLVAYSLSAAVVHARALTGE